jgi:hypothetical protein
MPSFVLHRDTRKHSRRAPSTQDRGLLFGGRKAGKTQTVDGRPMWHPRSVFFWKRPWP